jgi:hypothetical protein
MRWRTNALNALKVERDPYWRQEAGEGAPQAAVKCMYVCITWCVCTYPCIYAEEHLVRLMCHVMLRLL